MTVGIENYCRRNSRSSSRTWPCLRHIPVSRALKNIEQKILAAPDGPINWRIPLTWGTGQSTGEVIGWPQGVASDRFLERRTRYFNAVRGGTSELVPQGVDAGANATSPATTAGAYLSLLADLARRAERPQRPIHSSHFQISAKVLGAGFRLARHRGPSRSSTGGRALAPLSTIHRGVSPGLVAHGATRLAIKALLRFGEPE